MPADPVANFSNCFQQRRSSSGADLLIAARRHSWSPLRSWALIVLYMLNKRRGAREVQTNYSMSWISLADAD